MNASPCLYFCLADISLQCPRTLETGWFQSAQELFSGRGLSQTGVSNPRLAAAGRRVGGSAQ